MNHANQLGVFVSHNLFWRFNHECCPRAYFPWLVKVKQELFRFLDGLKLDYLFDDKPLQLFFIISELVKIN